MSPHARNILIVVTGMAAALLLAILLRGGDPESGSGESSAPVMDAGSMQFPERGARPALVPVRGAGPHSLKGTLRGAEGSAIADAAITAILELGPGVRGEAPEDAGPEGVMAIVAISNAEGSFVLEGMPAGRYRLRIEGEDIVSSELRFVEVPGEDLQILSARQVDLIGVTRFAGKGEAAVRVLVQAEGSLQPQELMSDASGNFELKDQGEGRYRVWAMGEERASRVVEVERFGTGPFASIELSLEPAFAAEGRVVEGGGSELGLPAEVLIRSAEGTEPARTTRAALDGSFRVGGLLSGRWVAEARAPGYLPSEALSFSAESGVSLQLELDAGGLVAGTVLGPNGEALAGASLRLLGRSLEGNELEYSANSQEPLASSLGGLQPGQRLVPKGELGVLLGPIPMPPPRGSASTRIAIAIASDEAAAEAEALPEGSVSVFVTDTLGHFRITGVASGDYQLLVAHSRFADASIGPLQVRRGGRDLGDLRVKLQAGASLLGSIRDDQGAAIAGASVFARFDDGRAQALTVSDSEGHYAFAPMVGSATIVVEALGYARETRKQSLRSKGILVVQSSLDFRLARADAAIAGRLVDDSGFPVRGAQIQVEESERVLPTQSQRSDEEGLFRLDSLPKGAHWIGIAHEEFPLHRVRLETGLAGDVLVPLGGGLALRLRDKQSLAPLAMAELELTPIGKGSSHKIMSDERGRVALMPIAPARYRLLVRAPGYGALSREILVPQSSRAAVPSLELDLELERGAILAGVLRDSAGERLVGARISVGPVQTESDREGRFRLENLPPGLVSIHIESGTSRSQQQVELQSGEERVTMELVHRAPGSSPASEDDSGDQASEDEASEGEDSDSDSESESESESDGDGLDTEEAAEAP